MQPRFEVDVTPKPAVDTPASVGMVTSAKTSSPRRHIDRLGAPLIVAYGTCETPEFQRQARDFAAAVKAAGKPVDLLVGAHYAHLELPETLCNPNGLLGAAVLEQMCLA